MRPAAAAAERLLPLPGIFAESGGSAVFPAAVRPDQHFHPDVHGAAQPAKPVLGQLAWGPAGFPGMADFLGPVFHLCGAVRRADQCVWLGVRRCVVHAVALLLRVHHVLRWRPEPVSHGAVKCGGFVNF